MSKKAEYFYEFETYRLRPSDPSLWQGDDLISISPKALEILILLVGKKGEIVSREELIETVWKDTFVEEGNINYTISLLRKIFENKDLIKTVPRHGYRFTGEVREIVKDLGTVTPISVSRVEPITRKKSLPLVLALVAVVLALSIGSFAYLSRVANSAKVAEESPTETSEAMQSYLRGKMTLDKRSVENREEKAIDEFQRAIMLDPTLAIAYAGLAEGYATSAVKIPFPKSRDTIAKARAAADKSLALEPNLAEGYLVRGWLKRNADWDWAGSEADLRRSIELSPKNAAAHQRLSQLLSAVGRHDEALLESNKALELDPISETMIGARFPILEARGEYDIALKESEVFLRENKASSPAARAYATFLYHNQNFQEVIVLAERDLLKNPGKTPFAWASLLSGAYYKIGDVERANKFLNELETMAQSNTKATYSLAMNYAEMGRHDDAFRALQECLEKREERMSWIKNEPRLANLREDERFRRILSEMNL